MEEQTLVKIALCTAILGIVTLFFLTPRLTLQDQTRQTLLLAEDKDTLVFQGDVQEIQQREGVIFLKLRVQETREVVLFTDDPLTITQNDRVEVTGKVATYEGKKEIIGDSVTVLPKNKEKTNKK
ncbi:hypothetical protein HYW21_03820 [Candidatus Woesearchaeota archaeon]|nr:hypothetical protein [Candidatus Woesearchaeota archaeon]